MIEIDGTIGEGGGQILRSSLTLSLMTNQAFHIFNIRAKRKNPGIRPQHLVAIEAAATICGGQVEGKTLGSQDIYFTPGNVLAGQYRFDIGTAGSTSLVLQTIFLPLNKAKGESLVTISGGTHVPWSPSFHYLDMHWIPFMRKMGFRTELSLVRAGFYPQGGGQVGLKLVPNPGVCSLLLPERGRLYQIRGISAVANLPRKIAERQRARVVQRLGKRYPLNDLRIGVLPSSFKGTVLLLLAEFENSQACFSSLGALGKPAEKVADEAIEALEDFMATDAPIDPYLADQLLLPMVFAPGSSTFRTSKVTQHLITNAAVIHKFHPGVVHITGELGSPGSVEVN